jgi:hypothetical protein
MTAITDIEMLYTVFCDNYDDDSIDEVYLMAGCDFNYAYDMLMLSFETNDIKMQKSNFQTQKTTKQTITRQQEYHETKQPTTSIPLMAFMKKTKK